MIFGKKKKVQVKEYDRENMYPIWLVSICTGETSAGFRDRRDHSYHEEMLVRTDADREEFCARYGLKPEDVRKEW